MIEMNHEIHRPFPRDQWHLDCKAIYAKLDTLKEQVLAASDDQVQMAKSEQTAKYETMRQSEQRARNEKTGRAEE